MNTVDVVVHQEAHSNCWTALALEEVCEDIVKVAGQEGVREAGVKVAGQEEECAMMGAVSEAAVPVGASNFCTSVVFRY